MNFSTKAVTVDTTPQGGGKYLNVGINDNVSLLSITSGASSQKGTPFLEVAIGKGADSSVKDKFYMSEKAQEKSQQKIIHLLVDGLGVKREAVDAAGDAATSLEDYAKRLNALIPKNNSYRQKFTGEEYIKQDSGQKAVAKRIGFIPFAEAMSVTPSKLTYDQTNKYDFAPLPVPNDGTQLAVAAGGDSEELPF